MVPAVIFDDGKGCLGPLTDLRAAFDVRTGALTSLERLSMVLDIELAALYVPDELEELTAEDHDLPINRMPVKSGRLLVVNGRCPIPPEELIKAEEGIAYVDPTDGGIVGGLLRHIDAVKVLVGEQPGCEMRSLDSGVLMHRPWHFRSVRDQAIRFDLDFIGRTHARQRLPHGVVVIGDAADVLLDPDAMVSPGVTIDVTSGPVSIAGDATVRPGVVIIGPAAIGPHSTISEHATIRANTAIGPWCKVGGEVSGVIFQGYANKVHDGFLGDSWVGQWVNMGAGTTNSNLLNTYGEVTAQAMPDNRREHTGETFLGAMIGDHVKTAICTRIMTGSVIHTGTMWAASKAITGCVKPFAWVTDAGEKPYRLNKFLDVARTVMARRDVEPSDAYMARLEVLHNNASVNTT